MMSFLIGSGLYPLLELLWRGRTHYSMALAGGFGGVVLHQLAKSRLRFFTASVAGGCAITLIEAGCGLVWNKRHRVWDYRRQPLNWRGQVCVPYALLWCALSAGFLIADRHALGRRRRSR